MTVVSITVDGVRNKDAPVNGIFIEPLIHIGIYIADTLTGSDMTN